MASMMTSSLEAALAIKQRANDAFRAEHNRQAYALYSEAITVLLIGLTAARSPSVETAAAEAAVSGASANGSPESANGVSSGPTLSHTELLIAMTKKLKEFAEEGSSRPALAAELKELQVLFTNRAFAAQRVEEYGQAVMDATTALRFNRALIDAESAAASAASAAAAAGTTVTAGLTGKTPVWTKALYRRGSALLAMGKHKDALRDFQECVRIDGATNPEAKEKLLACQKLIRKLAFEEAIATNEQSSADRIAAQLESYAVPADYSGPRMEPISAATAMALIGSQGGSEAGSAELEQSLPAITPAFVRELLGWQKAQKLLPSRYVYDILLRVKALLQKQPSLVDIQVPEGHQITVCGDVHGQYYDLLNIFEINGFPSETNPYLFNGDFVDRGSFSVEVIVALFAMKLMLPNHFFLARGNHETINMNKMYGFEGEVEKKYSKTLMGLFTEVFNWLPLAHVINQKVFVVHGGLFQSDTVTLEDIRKIDRNRQPPEEGHMTDMLWSDPQPYPGRAPSKRGTGSSFGPDVTEAFLDRNGLRMVVRSHEVKDEGYLVEHRGRLVTVFSAPNYCDQVGNKGAFIRFDAACTPVYRSFTHVPHPPVKAMAYTNNFGLF